MIVALCGGVGGSKLVLGLYRTLAEGGLTAVVNTADDLDFCGLHVSPDLDTVTYTLAGLAPPDVGWGIANDTLNALDMLARYGVPTWFQVGDRDLATDVYRTAALRRGETLTEVTQHLTAALGVGARILPMSDDPVATRLQVQGEWIPFQDYFVRLRHHATVDEIEYRGIEEARPSAAVLEAIAGAESIVLVNSNPVLSIVPILGLPGVREALEAARGVIVAVSPIVGGDAVSGPAGELMRLIGQPSSAVGVAGAYREFLDGLVIDRADADAVSAIEEMGVAVHCADTIMGDESDKRRLAAETLAFARSLV